jgi:hypothetical protein
MNNDHSGSHKSFKCVGVYLPSNNSCDSFRSSLVIFFEVVRFFYQNLFNNIDGIIIKALISLHCIFLFFFFCSFSSLFFFYCKLYQSIFSIWEGSRWYLWIARVVNIFCTNIIYDSLNCTIFLNIFYTILFYLVFLSTKVQNYLRMITNLVIKFVLAKIVI